MCQESLTVLAGRQDSIDYQVKKENRRTEDLLIGQLVKWRSYEREQPLLSEYQGK